MTATNVGDVRSAQALWLDRLLADETPTPVRYAGIFVGDASPAASELFINGERNSRFWLPTDSYVFGRFIGAAWNLTLGDAPGGVQIDFGIENDNGTVAAAPTNLSGTDGNPIALRNGEAGTWALSADNTNKAIRINFTPTANHTYRVHGILMFALAASKSNPPNAVRQVN